MSAASHVLIVDDDRALRLALSKALRRKGCEVTEAEDGERALSHLLPSPGQARPDVCVLDLRMPTLDGLSVLRKTVGRTVPVVVLTGHGSVEDAVEAMRLGAANFLQKPVDADELWPVLEQAIGAHATAGEILGGSPAMQDFITKLDKAAKSEEPVLFLGETGTGKELAARRLHDQSANRDGPFVALNAACVPRELFESELFGHKKGAFTGATTSREGLLAEAGGGTLFIDEIGDLPIDAQAKLLRAIEERRFRPVGADTERPFRARLCAATHQALPDMVEEGTFRADLFYRLGVVPLRIPPLRERGNDILIIADYWLDRLSEIGGVQYALTDDARAMIRSHPFVGNVRELINLMKRAVILSSAPTIDRPDIERLLKDNPFTTWGLTHAPDVVERTGADQFPSMRAGERVTLEALERAHICRLLDELNNVSEVARIVGIDRRTLQRKMVAWGMRESG